MSDNDAEFDVSDQRVAELREALDELRAGKPGVSLEEFDRNFRQRHGLPPPDERVED